MTPEQIKALIGKALVQITEALQDLDGYFDKYIRLEDVDDLRTDLTAAEDAMSDLASDLDQLEDTAFQPPKDKPEEEDNDEEDEDEDEDEDEEEKGHAA